MKQGRTGVGVRMMKSAEELVRRYQIGAGDLVLISDTTMARSFRMGFGEAIVVNYRKYGKGEPTDLVVEAIAAEIGGRGYSRVFGIGGGTVLDMAKLFALDTAIPVAALFLRTRPIVRKHRLVLVPTTCGTGSEVTDISILELTALKTKLGLADPALLANEAVLIPELLDGLPPKVFATSSIDALIHAVESFLSPKADFFTKIYSEKAIRMILAGYQSNSFDWRRRYADRFLQAAMCAGLAFGQAGTGAVHALSYPFGAAKHVPHGEANYVMFLAVLQKYCVLSPDMRMSELEELLFEVLKDEEITNEDEVYYGLEKLLARILPYKPLREYGVTEEDLEEYTDIVMTKQGRLMATS